MPTGRKGQKRPADVAGNAVHVMKIATGEVEEGAPIDDDRDLHAKAMAKKGGAAGAKAMTPERRAEIAKRRLPKTQEKQSLIRAENKFRNKILDSCPDLRFGGGLIGG